MEDTQTIRAQIRYETDRKCPPEGFPQFPDLPGKRYTDPRLYELEKQHLWRTSWLLAGHLDEIPEPGCFKVWDTAGQPVVILHTRTGVACACLYAVCLPVDNRDSRGVTHATHLETQTADQPRVTRQEV